ncbi:MAG: COX15/CtaA family protein, partial [Anaerolineae bacterium]|nr:COX15/CtaA family protein [Anaerolineae bacterium]
MKKPNDAKTRYLLLFTALSVYLLIAVGGAVRVTGSGLGCPDWPTCFGQWLPPTGSPALLNYSHRLLTLVSGVLLGATIWRVWKYLPAERLVRTPLTMTAAVFGLQSLLGAFMVWMKMPAWSVAVHHAAALVMLGLVMIPLIYLFMRAINPDQEGSLRFRSSFSRLSLSSAAAIFVVFVSGTALSGIGDTGVCTGWPLCNGEWMPVDLMGWLFLGHRLIVGGVGLLIMATLLRAWRTQRSQRAILSTATITAGLYIGQVLVGAAMATRPLTPDLVGLHVATVGAVWAAGAALFTFTGLAGRTEEEEQREAQLTLDRRQRMKDMVML